MPDGYRLIALDGVDSTNLEALRRAAGGAPHGTVVSARSQNRGRGRRDRQWYSPPGNLHMSIVVRPQPGKRPLGQIAFVAGVAVADALAPYALVRLKWPNDVLVDGHKVAGILIEAEGTAAAVGIGVNLASAPEDTPFPATRIADGPPPECLLADICLHFERRYRSWLVDGFASLRAAWLDRADGIGGPIEARLPAKTLTGTFVGLDADGALLLDRPDGSRAAVAAGDVFFGTG